MKKLALFAAALLFVPAAMAKDDRGRGKDRDEKSQGKGAQKGDAHPGRGGDPAPTSAWQPRQVTREDKRGIEAHYRALDAAWERRDLQTVSRMISFPVLMVTDDARGEGEAAYWSREQYLQEMGQAMAGMPSDLQVKSKRRPFFITNDLAVVEVENEVRLGRRKLRYRSADVLMRRNGQWVTKATIEGGWGGDGDADAGGASPANPGHPGVFVPGGNPNSPRGHGASAPGGTPNTRPTADTKPSTGPGSAPDSKDAYDPKGRVSPSGSPTSKDGHDPKSATAPSPGTSKEASQDPAPTSATSKGSVSAPGGKAAAGGFGGKMSAPDAGTPDAGVQLRPWTKGSRRGATQQ